MSAARLIGLDDRAGWEAALRGLDCSYWHGWQAHRALLAGTASRAFLFVHEDVEGGRAACPFAERDWGDAVDIYTPAGFGGFVASGECPQARAAWDAMVRDRGYVAGYFALHPEVSRTALHVGVVPSHPLYTIDLSEGADAALTRASRTVRRSLAEWERSACRYVEDRKAVSGFLAARYGEFMRDAGARAHAIWSAETLWCMLDDPDVLMVGAADEGGIRAAHSFAVRGTGAEAHLSLSVGHGREYTTALLAWGFRRLASLGVRWLHLGGGIRPDDGVARGKQKFHPRERVLLAAREIYDPAVYQRLCSASGHGPDPGTGFFPAYRDLNPASAPGS